MNFDPIFILPELILAIGALIVLAVGLRARKCGQCGGVYSPHVPCIGVLVLALFPLVMTVGEGMKFDQFNGMYAIDGLAVFLKIIAILGTIIVAFISIDYFRKLEYHAGEFYSLLIFATLAICCLVSSNDLVMIYLSMEFLSITSYILAGYLKQEPRSNEAAIKYFLYGSAAAAVMIYGMSMLYGLTASTNLSLIGAALGTGGVTPLAYLSLIMILAGMGFKIAMFPFHQWSPDTYEGAPTPITAFLSVGPKAAGFAVLVRFLTVGINAEVLDWTPLIIILSALTMTVGNLIAIPQTNIKRMLAYSSIAQAGYLLLGVAALPFSSVIALKAVLIYLFVYLFMNLGAFAVVNILSSRLGSDDIRSYAGLIRRAPSSAVAMVFFLLSLAGIPPTAGFLGKFYLFAAALQSGDTALFWLSVAAIINTVISVYYYMNVVRYMFFVEPADSAPIKGSLPIRLAVAFTFIMTIAVLVYPQPFLETVRISASILGGM